ncbi:MAG: RloB domain-containing protein [Nostoc sp.]
MMASEDEKMLDTNSFMMPNTDRLRLLSSAVIYGSNASGKSNLVRAIQTLRRLVMNSATKMQVGEKLPIEPFRLNNESAKNPTSFEVIFIHQSTRYEYGVSLNRERIYEEWLIAYPNEHSQNWFSRQYLPDNPKYQTDEGYKWSFGKGLKGEKLRIKKFVRSNSLFLSHAAQNNHPQLTEIFEWFQDEINILTSNSDTMEFTLSLFDKGDTFQPRIAKLLSEADLGISGIKIEQKPIPDRLSSFFNQFIKQETEQLEKDFINNLQQLDIITLHKMNNFDNDNKIEKFKQALLKAKENNIVTVTSIPCFEFWFLLHYVYTTAPSSHYKELCPRLETEMRKAGIFKTRETYDKSDVTLYKKLKPYLENALTNAMKLELDHLNEDSCTNPSTKVHILVQQLKDQK